MVFLLKDQQHLSKEKYLLNLQVKRAQKNLIQNKVLLYFLNAIKVTKSVDKTEEGEKQEEAEKKEGEEEGEKKDEGEDNEKKQEGEDAEKKEEGEEAGEGEKAEES